MMNKLYKILDVLRQLNYRFLLSKSIIRNEKKSVIKIDDTVKILNCKIYVSRGSSLIIEKDCILKNLNLSIKGDVILGRGNLIDNGYLPSRVNILVDGTFTLGDYNRLRSNIWVRFNGKLHVGTRNNINEESEIRCDDSIEIGNYNQISYKCMIWDTNTHNIYSKEKRRELTDRYYPIFGYEYEKPKTKPIKVGDDCWIGREAALLKGAVIGNSSIVGFRAIVSNCAIETYKIVVSKGENLVINIER